MENLKIFILLCVDGIANTSKYIVYRILLLCWSLPEKIMIYFLNATDVKFNGSNPWDIKVNHPNFYARCAAYGTIGIGESYEEGWWDCEEIDSLVCRLFRSGTMAPMTKPYRRIFQNLRWNFFNTQTVSMARQVVNHHYELGKDIFEATLDPSMNYSCGYWKTATDLTQAQIDKMDLIGRKLMLNPGMRVLNIGTGFGGVEKYLCEKFGVTVVGYTLAPEMAKEAQRWCQGLNVEIHLQDYRTITGKFDRIISIAMIEHVGVQNYREYFTIANRCLVDDGLFLLESPYINNSDVPCNDGYINKALFNNVYYPSLEELVHYTDKLFIVEDLENFGAYFDQTFLSWARNFENNWSTISSKYGPLFYRRWRYFLLGYAGGSRARAAQCCQIVFSKAGLIGGYESIR